MPIYAAHHHLLRVVNMETLHMGLSAEEEEVMNSSQADPLRSHMKALRSSASAQNQNQKRSGSGGEGEQVSKKARVAGEKKEDEQEEEEGEGDGDQHSDDGGEAEGGAEQIEAIDEGDAPAAIASDAIEGSVSHQARMNKRIMNRPKPAINGTYTSFVARPICSMKGHTAFLTFAIRSVD
ncbi:hypothetical protein EON65_10300 [archaeon]|nr:MAG: hypothetical protein EON65_10300 [archaeon]